MTEVEELKGQLEDINEKYKKLIDLRVELLDNGRMAELKEQDGGMSLYFKEEVRLYEEAEEIREKLANLDHENFHFGKKNSSSGYIRKVPEYSLRGDLGFFRCFGCKELFDGAQAEKWIKKISRKKTGGRKRKDDEVHDRGTFLRCCFHKGLKSGGQMRLKKEELVWL